MTAIKPLAYGVLGLKPWELGQLQPYEIYAMIDGYNHKQKIKDERNAYWISLILNVSGKSYKRHIKPADLLKPLYPSRKKVTDQANKEYFKQLFKLEK